MTQTLEATHEEIQPDPEEMPQQLRFGWAVAVRDETAFVGMPDAFDKGRVAIFTQTASGWQRTGTLTAPDTAGEFGKSLTFRDGYVMVGASRAVYVFKRGGGQWNLSQRLARPAAASTSDFARSIHYEDGILVIGTRSESVPGTAYVFERNAQGKFALRTAITAADGHNRDLFGNDVSAAGGVVVVGAPGNSGSAGAAYVFRRNSSGSCARDSRRAIREHAAWGGPSQSTSA